MSLAQVAKEVIGKSYVFVKYQADEALDPATTIGDVASKSAKDSIIIDLVVKKEKLEANAPPKAVQANEDKVPKASKDQPLLKLFEEKGGIFDLIKAAKAAVGEYKSEKLKEMW